MAADFKTALQHVLENEGGYSKDPNDPGGETYKGVARKMNSGWIGWTLIDLQKQKPNFPANLANNAELNSEIEQFYLINYWDTVKGSDIIDQDVATSIFDFAVNGGVKTSSALAQQVAGVEADGVIGPNSITAINAMKPGDFLAFFALAKIARYVAIVKKRPTSQKYFYGWVRRTLGDL